MKTQHCTAAPHSTISGWRTHKFQNWINYRTPKEGFRASSPRAANAQGVPPDWGGGQFDFSYSSLEAPLQVFARDATDVGNRAMVGVRRSDRPGAWLNMKALDVEASDIVVTDSGRTITYPGLWPGCDLVYEVGGHKLKETVVVWDKFLAPPYFEWTLKYPPSHTIDVAENVFALLDGEGNKEIETQTPWGEDSSTLALTLSGHQYIRCTLTEENARGGFRVVRLTPNPDDMEGGVGVIRLDPTTTISGTVDIEDSFVGDFPLGNTGGGDLIAVGYDSTVNLDRALVRIATIGSIPSGTITAFRYIFWHVSYANSTNSNNIDFFAIKDANDWTELGVVWGTTDGVTPWAGSDGCGTSGTDYDAEGSPPTWASPAKTSGPPVEITVALVPQWATDWRDSVRDSNGILARAQDETTLGAIAVWNSSEALTNKPIFEVDVEVVGAKYFFIGF